MRFLEKNLESIIWNELEYCRSRGLNLEPMEKQRFRQLNLAPLGVADIIHMGFDYTEGRTHIQIIECKKDIVNVATYAQTCRYQTAIAAIMGCCDSNPIIEKVLVGQRVDPKGEFWHIARQDELCRVFTYDYKADGIYFTMHNPYKETGWKGAGDIYRPTTDLIMSWVTPKTALFEVE